MARYTYISPFTEKELELDDWMMTENGIEAIQVKDEKVILILILPDGSIIMDKESGKSADSMQKAREEYQKMAENQRESFRDRANQIIREAVEQGKEGQPTIIDPEDDEPEVPYHSPPGPEPTGYA